MLIYNSLTGKKEKLVIPKNRPLKLFVCGPTVYDASHIGHARTYLVFDVLARFLRSRGINLLYLENITDVDDRIIARARNAYVSPFAIARAFEKEFMSSMRAIGAVEVDQYARASDHIPEIVAQIKTLIRKGYAYEISGDGWYFDVKKFPSYGTLSRRTVAQAEDSVSRIDANIRKKNRADFCLWKFVTTQKRVKPLARGIENSEPFWNTSLGYGRPGWHIEDTAISEKYLGPQYDLHGGGVDLKFPHHEAEIAQAESASGKRPFVRIWLHAGSLLVEGRKMSKSLKNFITIREFLGKKVEEKKRATLLRLIILSSHYRSPLHFTANSAEQAEKMYENISFSLDALRFAMKNAKKAPASNTIKKEIKTMENSFLREMEDDMNTAGALASLFSFFQKTRFSAFTLSKEEAKLSLHAAENLLSVFGISIKTATIPTAIASLATKRELYRRNKQFVQADALRKKAHALGYEVSDTPLGPFVRKREV